MHNGVACHLPMTPNHLLLLDYSSSKCLHMCFSSDRPTHRKHSWELNKHAFELPSAILQQPYHNYTSPLFIIASIT